MPRAALALLLLALSSCSTGSTSLPTPKLGSSNDGLSFAQVQAIQPGLSAAQVRDAYGEPKRVSRRECGTVERMEYAATDAKGGTHSLFLEFDGREILRQKTFSGAILRP